MIGQLITDSKLQKKEMSASGHIMFDILVVDDIKDNLLALNAILQRDDVRIFQALAGNQALELMLKNDFCLAILDVRMPGMSGFELAELMRGSRKTKDIPIIFVTATAKEQSFAFKGYESGAVDFLLKPLDTQAVRSKVNIFIELHRQKNELKEQLNTITSLLANLSHAKDAAERANSSKSQFLANMSHEIRTPIGAILGFTDLMKNPDNSAAENRDYMEIIDRNSQQMLRLIDDILDLSKVEAGMMTIEDLEFSLADLLADINSVMTFKAHENGIEFSLSLETLIPNIISSDQLRVRQIINNLLGNAFKFTAKGSVQLKVSHEKSNLVFKVVDTGVGISPEQETRLFKPFAQADLSTTRKFGGTGLGLVLSRRLAETLGGELKLSASAEGGAGSAFTFSMPCVQTEEAEFVDVEAIKIVSKAGAEARKDGFSLSRLKILLAEDSPDNQFLINMYLCKEGAKVTIVSDGSQAVKLALTGDFDIVLMDIQMPILDGHEATKMLRRAQFTKPIIALTAHAMKEEKEKCIGSGFTDFLTKPIQRDRLISVLASYSPKATSDIKCPPFKS